MKITYLQNSGFLVELDKIILVFDDYADEQDWVGQALAKDECQRAYIFASHAHYDHFDTHIAAYADRVNMYLLSNDIKHTRRSRFFPAGKVAFIKKYDHWEDEAIRVTSFDSTDVGTSFLVEAEGQRIFHAGDFNWWYWSGEPERDQKLARNGFMKQMKKLEGLEADVAFFPVDKRMGEFCHLGAREFCARTRVKALITMHNENRPAWEVPGDFFAPGREIPVWSPAEPGENKEF